MILPSKHIPLHKSLLGVGAALLKRLDRPTTVTVLWERCHEVEEIGSFERFVKALDLLFALGIIRFDRGLLVKAE